MRRSVVVASTVKRFVQGQGKPVITPPSLVFRCWGRAFSGAIDGYSERLRSGLRDIKLDDAVGLFSEMVKSRPFPSIMYFNKLLNAIAKMKKYDVVISLAEKLSMLGIPHDICTCNILINCLCRSSQVPLALALLGKMMKLGSGPSIDTLSSLLNGYCHSDRVCEAVNLVYRMSEMGYIPDSVTFTTLINGLFLHNKVSEAVALLERMVRKGCPPSLVTYYVVVNGVSTRGHTDLCLSGLSLKEAKHYTKKEAKRRKRFKLREGDALFGKMKMKEDGPLPESGTYKTLITTRLKDGQEAVSAEIIKELRSRGFTGDESTGCMGTNMVHDGRLVKSFLDMLSLTD